MRRCLVEMERPLARLPSPRSALGWDDLSPGRVPDRRRSHSRLFVALRSSTLGASPVVNATPARSSAIAKLTGRCNHPFRTQRPPPTREVGAEACELVHLRSGQCRFPLGDDRPARLFCGAATVGTSSCCEYHLRVVSPSFARSEQRHKAPHANDHGSGSGRKMARSPARRQRT